MELVRGPLRGSGRFGTVWQGQVNGTLVAHADLEKAKAKVDWLIWNECASQRTPTGAFGNASRLPVSSMMGVRSWEAMIMSPLDAVRAATVAEQGAK